MRRARIGKRASVIWVAVALGAGCTATRTDRDRTCASCRQPITGTFVEAEGAYFHPRHFACAYCEESIETDTYVSAGGKHYHASCYADHVVVCAHCGEPTREEAFVAHDGKTYHRFCFRRYVVTCAFCGYRIRDDTFKSSQGEYYHNSCYEEWILPECAFCGNPIRDRTYTSSRGKDYHRFCYQEFVVLRCTLCGEGIDGNYVTDYWGGTYHAYHQTDSPSCDFCGRFLRAPLEGGAVKYDDGRFLCGSCHTSAVKTATEVEEVALMVSDRLRRMGIDVDVEAISIDAVGADEMRRLNRYRRHKLTGLTDYREVVGVPGRTTYEYIEVYVLYGMPRVQMIAAIAHELTHVWQLLHGRLKINLRLAEGSCNYAAYRVLEGIPGGESEYLIHQMMVDEDTVYGESFRRVKQYAEENGVSGWLTLLKNNGPLPRY